MATTARRLALQQLERKRSSIFVPVVQVVAQSNMDNPILTAFVMANETTTVVQHVSSPPSIEMAQPCPVSDQMFVFPSPLPATQISVVEPSTDSITPVNQIMNPMLLYPLPPHPMTSIPNVVDPMDICTDWLHQSILHNKVLTNSAIPTLTDGTTQAVWLPIKLTSILHYHRISMPIPSQ